MRKLFSFVRDLMKLSAGCEYLVFPTSRLAGPGKNVLENP